MWEWDAPEGWRAYDDLCQKALEAGFRSYAGGLRMRVGWFAAVPGRQYTVHFPSRRYGGVFKQQNMTTGVYRKVRRDGQEQHVGYGDHIETSLWGSGGEDDAGASAPPPPPPDAPPPSLDPPPSFPSSTATSSQPRKWANPILTTQKSVDLTRAIPLPISVLKESFQWKEEKETTDAEGLTITAVVESKDGAGGVLFVETNKGVFVLKASSTMAADLFANQIGVKYFKLKVPFCRLISFGSKEFSDLAVRCLEQLVRQHPDGEKKIPYRPEKDWYLSHPLQELVRLAGSSSRIFGSGFIMVMEFIPGCELSKLNENNVMGTSASMRSARFADLGAMVCLDLLCNNWDRLPLTQLWDHAGNLGNIMLTAEGIVAIDNSVTAIKADRDKTKLQSYLQGVWKITSDAFRCHFSTPTTTTTTATTTISTTTATTATPKIARCFQDVRTALWAINGFDIGDECLYAMQKRFVECVKAISSLSLAQLETLHGEVKQQFFLEHMEVTDDSVGFNRVDFQFFQYVVEQVFKPLSLATSWVETPPHFLC